MSESPASPRGVPIRWSLIRNLCLLIVLLTGTILASTFYTGRRIFPTKKIAQPVIPGWFVHTLLDSSPPREEFMWSF